MKKITISLLKLSFLWALLMGCNNKVVPLQGQYQDDVYEHTTASEKEQVYSKLVDFLIAKSIPVRDVDKNRGLITTENISLLGSYTWENKKSTLNNPDAFVVCSKVRGPFTLPQSLKPTTLTGQWVFRIKNSSGKVVVETKLINTSGKVIIPNTNTASDTDVPAETYKVAVKSKGVFEKELAAALN